MIDIESITAPIEGDNPAGEDLRYTGVYDAIKEARRADDSLSRGDWEREVKASDWNEVIKLSVTALSSKTKDLQIAAWLTEALVKKQGFEGLAAGLKIINAFLRLYWENLYPRMEDGDLEYRVGTLEFLNDKLWTSVKDVPLTDPDRTAGFSWLKWQESRKVGFEKDILNQYGDVDEGKKRARDELIAEGKITGEEFDSGVAASSEDFYEKCSALVKACLEEFTKMDSLVDEKFGKDAPRLSELKAAIEDCDQLVSRILKDKRQQEPDVAPVTSDMEVQMQPGTQSFAADAAGRDVPVQAAGSAGMGANSRMIPVLSAEDQGAVEQALWEEALQIVQKSGIRQAFEVLSSAANSAPSIRQQNRYRLLIGKLCLKVSRPDLARPIIEGLYNLIGELGLEKWESPVWIAEVIDAYYQCLTSDGASDEDRYKAQTELFQKLCTRDITKAMVYKVS